MVKMSLKCEVCGKEFEKKAGLSQHKLRKVPCVSAANVITEAPSAQTQVMPSAQTLQNTAVSLFSGCGGDSLGLERAGFKVIGFSELKKTFIETHLENFPDSKLITTANKDSTDILKIEDSQFATYSGKVDVVFAGFPCQGFSNAGKKQADDPRNQLYRQFVRAVKVIRPLFIIGENVQGLEKMKSGPLPTDPLVIQNISAAFAEIGYSISYKVHETTQFGVPQKRKRVLIIGWDSSRVLNFMSTKFWASVEDYGKENVLAKMSEFVSNSMEGAYEVPTQFIPQGFATYALPVASDAVPIGVYHPYVKLKVDANLLSCTKRESAIHSEVIDLASPSKTIICTYAHQPRLLVGLRRDDGKCFVRALLPDELKQIQGFPANYKLKGTLSEKIIQVGNAVPPPMITALAKAIRLNQ